MNEKSPSFHIPERGRKRLDCDQYRQLCQQVLERDGWRCQFCGIRRNLHVHHIEFRSQGGADTEQNLITLCASCHREVHEPALTNPDGSEESAGREVADRGSNPDLWDGHAAERIAGVLKNAG